MRQSTKRNVLTHRKLLIQMIVEIATQETRILVVLIGPLNKRHVSTYSHLQQSCRLQEFFILSKGKTKSNSRLGFKTPEFKS